MRSPHEPWIRLAQLIEVTRSEGPGRRFAVWFQGCPMSCPGCCNPEMISFQGGRLWSQDELEARLSDAARRHRLDGVTLLGGEPFAHAEAAAWLAQAARGLNLSVMTFSGFTLSEIKAAPGRWPARLLNATDVLVDGQYEAESRTTERRWVGSANQQMHFLTGRYRADDPCWSEKNTVELRLEGGELMFSGFPDGRAVAAVRKWERRA